ncbi:MAG TPA: porin family protein [Chitinophagaceae bacterium]|nr:porin family protein [Chitinophagaceae bacterium]
MKKTFLFAIALFAIHSLHAQKTTFGIKAGVNTNAFVVRGESGGDKVSYSASKIGFQAGGVADISFSEHFSIQPNLLVVLKGGKYPASKYAINIFSADLPINFLYKNNGFFAGAGPNLSYGISGKIKAEDETIDVYSDEAGEIPLKRFEMGANLLMGYQFAKGVSISANYTLGVSNILNVDDPGDSKVNNNYLGLSIGFNFGK